MALIIHQLSTDQAEHYGDQSTVRILTTERMHLLTMAVTIETPKDLPAFHQFMDAFISKHTTLLPDYRSIKFPCGRLLSIVIATGNAVTISFDDVELRGRGTTFSYEVPSAQQLALPDPERHRGWLMNSN